LLRCIAQVIVKTRKWYIIEDSGTGRCKVVTRKSLLEVVKNNKDKFTGVKRIDTKIVITDDTDIIQMDEWLDKRAILFICDNSAYVMYGEHKPGIFVIPLIDDNGFIYESIDNISICINGKLKDKCSLRDITRVNMYGNNDKLKSELGNIPEKEEADYKEEAIVSTPDTQDKEVTQEENQIIMEELDLVSTEKEYTNKHNDFSEKLQSGYYSTVDFSKVDFSLFSDDELKQLIDGGDKVFISIKAKAKLVYEDRHTLTDEEEESQFVKFAVESGFIQQNEIPDNYIIPPIIDTTHSETKDTTNNKINLLEKAEERGIVIPGEIICYHWKIWNVNMCQKMSKICCIYILYMLHFIWDTIHHCLQAAYYQNYHYYQNYQHAILPYADI
jgi:hypothetical protein